MKNVYPSAVNYWAASAIFAVVLLGMLFFIIGHLPLVITLGFGVLFLGPLVPMYLKTIYIIDGDLLKIRCGWTTRKDIPIATIREIKKAQYVRIGGYNSPALSDKEAITVYYNKYDSITISPIRRAEFIAGLKAINHNIQADEQC